MQRSIQVPGMSQGITVAIVRGSGRLGYPDKYGDEARAYCRHGGASLLSGASRAMMPALTHGFM